MTTADYVTVGDTVRYTNTFNQVMVGKVVRKYHQYVMVKRDCWPAVESVNPSDYVTFEVIANG